MVSSLALDFYLYVKNLNKKLSSLCNKQNVELLEQF